MMSHKSRLGTFPLRSTRSVSPLPTRRDSDEQNPTHYSLIRLRLFAGSMRIDVPDDYEEEDVIQLIKEKHASRIRKATPKLNWPKEQIYAKDSVVPSAEAPKPQYLPQAENSSKSKNCPAKDIQKASPSSEGSTETQSLQRNEKDSRHGATPSSANEEQNAPVYDQHAQFDSIFRNRGIEFNPTLPTYEPCMEYTVELSEHLYAPGQKQDWLDTMSEAFTKEIEENERILESMRAMVNKAKSEAISTLREIDKADDLIDGVEREVLNVAGSEVLEKYRCKVAASRSSTREESARKAGPSDSLVRQVDAPQKVEKLEPRNVEQPAAPSCSLPKVEATASVPQRSPVRPPQAPTAIGKKRQRGSRFSANSSVDSGDEGDDEGPVAKKMRYSDVQRDGVATTTRPSSRIRGSRAIRKEPAPESVVASGSNLNIAPRASATPVSRHQSASVPLRAPNTTQSRVENEMVTSAKYKANHSKEQKHSSTHKSPSHENDATASHSSSSLRNPVKAVVTTTNASKPSMPDSRRRSRNSGLIHSIPGRLSGSVSQQAAERAGSQATPHPMGPSPRRIVHRQSAKRSNEALSAVGPSGLNGEKELH
ncbi:hypothetical protein BDY19DRAFT_453981 [Irpex rosettiformis]|uniref:Uncharacterized protein n=1 Tax=Irpex rosettiformis TaxID=378272 RepID=A0ACB8TT99_9APHY|nr:hypothetical protein BDY19DRAFT_453981 [Irpex rosettiformis]